MNWLKSKFRKLYRFSEVSEVTELCSGKILPVIMQHLDEPQHPRQRYTERGHAFPEKVRRQSPHLQADLGNDQIKVFVAQLADVNAPLAPRIC